MLKCVKVENEKIWLHFDFKTKGKFRFKKIQDLNNPYTQQLKKEEISKTTKWYLEWMITYFIYKKNDAELRELLIDLPIKRDGNKKVIYPYELPGLYIKAIDIGLLSMQDHQSLLSWICNSKETFYNKFMITSNDRGTVKINDLSFRCYDVRLPLLVLENSDGTWIEIMLQKQQYAYSVQPFVFLCIPHNAFIRDREELVWSIGKRNIDVLLNLFKVFSSASKSHKEDVCRMLKALVLNNIK